MLGEGPMWHPAENALYWVHCSGKKIHRLDPDAPDASTAWTLPTHIGCLVIRATGGFMAAVTSGFVAVELPPGGGEAVVTDYAPLEQDTGANYDPDLGFDPAALVSLVLGPRDERRQVRPRRPVLGGHRPHAKGYGGREE